MRNKLRVKRRNLDKKTHYKCSIKILYKLLKNNLLRYNKIAIYLPNDGELSTDKIINFLAKKNKCIYLPVVHKGKLKFAKIGKQYKLNKFKIKEPINTEIIHAKQINLIITPLVGFDNFGNRIGMGGGFYDKTFSFKLTQNIYKYPKLFGIAFNFQNIIIKPNPWDVKLDKIISV